MTVDDRDLPPDPWVEEGIDLWAVEQSERLAHEGVSPSDPRWDHLDGPTTDEFDDAEAELRAAREPDPTDIQGLLAKTLFASVAVVAALALLILVLR